MNKKIYYKDQKFYVDGKETFIMGAEVHYWRVPKNKWKDRLLKIKESGCNLVSTYINWAYHEEIEGQIDVTGTTVPEKDLKGFLELAKDMGFLVLVRPGPYIMSEVRTHGLPEWLFSSYPEVVAKRMDGSNHMIVSYSNETYLKLVDRWYEAVFNILTPLQISRGGNIIMAQLDNEVGMFTWVTNHPDYSDEVLKQFISYLEKKFTQQGFNETFASEEASIHDFVFKYMRHPRETKAIPVMNEFMLFHREYYRDYIINLKNIAEKHGMDIPIVVNVHGFHSLDYAKRGTQYPIGLSQLLKTNEIEGVVIAGDYYVGNLVPDNFYDITLANALTKAIQPKAQPLFSAEFQSGFQVTVPRLQPTTTDLKSRLCIGDGMNAINYYMFVGGENPANMGIFGRRHDWQAPIGMDGSLRPHFYLVEHLSKVLRAYESELLDAKPETVLHLGFDPNIYMTEYDNNYTRAFKQEIQRMRETILFNGMGKALSFLNIPFNGLNLQEESPIDVKEVPVLWTFSTGYMDAPVQQKLLDYVNNGGKLILQPIMPTKDFNQNDCTILIDGLGISIKDRSDWQFIDVEDIDNIGSVYSQSFNVTEGFAHREGRPQEIVGYKQTVGKGEIVVFGVGFLCEHDYKIEAHGRVARQAGLEALVKTDAWLNIQVRRGEKGTFLFINNLEDYAKTSTFNYKNEQLFDGKPLTLPMRSGLILPINWQVSEDLRVLYSTAEVTNKVVTDEKTVLDIKANGEEWIKLQTPGEVTVKNGHVINEGNNTYKVIAFQASLVEITVRK